MSRTLARPDHTPTGLDELTPVRTVSAAPEHLRVSVFAPRQQLDITLPADARVADVLPYLNRLIAGHESAGAEPPVPAAGRTERTLLRRGAADGAALPAAETLRDAGVRQGDVLFLGAERTLVPPTLHDDVVDAAAQLNRAAFASWNRSSAAAMACVALYACVAVLAWMSWDARFEPVRPVVVGIDLFGALALLTAATVAYRMHHVDRVAALCAWAGALLIGAALVALTAALQEWGPVLTAAAWVAVSYGGYRLVGAGRWGFLAGSLFAVFAGLAYCLRAGTDISDVWIGMLTCLGALVSAAVLPRVAGRLSRPGRRRRSPSGAGESDAPGDPFGAPAVGDAGSTDAVPTAEAVMVRTRRAAECRAALYAGAGAALSLGSMLLLNGTTEPQWAPPVFVALCAAVLSLRARICPSAVEQACVLVPGGVALLLAAVSALSGPPAFAVAGMIGLAGIVGAGAAVAVISGRPVSPRRRSGVTVALDYLDYLAVGALIPTAVAVVEGYALVGDHWM